MSHINQDIDRSPPITILLSAESYFRVAEHAQVAWQNRTLRLRFEMPIYYLYSDALELTMKAFLHSSGMTLRNLRRPKLRHSLLELWNECVGHNLRMDVSKRRIANDVIEMLDPYAANYEFRYIQTGSKTLPALEVVHDVIADLIGNIRYIVTPTK